MLLVVTGIGLAAAPSPVSPQFEVKRVEGEYRVISAPRTGHRSDWCIVESQDRRFALFLGRPTDPLMVSLGDRLKIDGYSKPFPEGSDSFWLGKGVMAIIQLGESSVVRIKQGPPLFRWGQAWRASFQEFTARTFNKENADLIDALCFNVDAALEPGFRDDLRATGTVHIVSASGLHVMLLAFATLWGLSKLPIPRSIQLFLLIALLMIYAGGAGFRPPVVRAVVMAMLLLSAYLFRREPDLLSAAGVAAMGQLLLDPWSVFDLGFYLSFVTVVAIGLYMNPNLQSRLLRSAQVSWIATLASAPVVAFAFGRISLIAVVANLLIGFVILPIIAGSLLCWGVALVFPDFGTTMARGIVTPFASYLAWAVRWLADIPLASVATPPFSAYWIPAFYGLMLSIWKLRKRSAPPDQETSIL